MLLPFIVAVDRKHPLRMADGHPKAFSEARIPYARFNDARFHAPHHGGDHGRLGYAHARRGGGGAGAPSRYSAAWPAATESAADARPDTVPIPRSIEGASS